MQTLTSEGTPTSPMAPQGPFPHPWKQRAARLTWDELLNCPAPTAPSQQSALWGQHCRRDGAAAERLLPAEALK